MLLHDIADDSDVFASQLVARFEEAVTLLPERSGKARGLWGWRAVEPGGGGGLIKVSVVEASRGFPVWREDGKFPP